MSEQEYIKIKERLVKGEKLINENGGFLHAPIRWVNLYQKLAEQFLLYEIENNLLPI